MKRNLGEILEGPEHRTASVPVDNPKKIALTNRARATAWPMIPPNTPQPRGHSYLGEAHRAETPPAAAVWLSPDNKMVLTGQGAVEARPRANWTCPDSTRSLRSQGEVLIILCNSTS